MATKDLTDALSSPYSAYEFARDVIKGRWCDGESVIAQNAVSSLYYAMLINDRFPLGEAEIAKDPDCAFNYAEKVMKERQEQRERAELERLKKKFE
jgi:hypothetical protein